MKTFHSNQTFTALFTMHFISVRSSLFLFMTNEDKRINYTLITNNLKTWRPVALIFWGGGAVLSNTVGPWCCLSSKAPWEEPFQTIYIQWRGNASSGSDSPWRHSEWKIEQRWLQKIQLHISESSIHVKAAPSWLQLIDPLRYWYTVKAWFT